MTDSAVRLSYGDSELWAVPSIHFRLMFAESVNRMAGEVRPDAVAVELGPQAAVAAAQWLRELGANSNPRTRVALPCMLGLTRPNRMIHPDHKDAALRLQQLTGRDLHEHPPELLKELLGYSSMSVLFLSPTDSIVEAVRCAIELDVPLYGVDLEETADARRPSILLRPPEPVDESQFSLAGYVQSQSGFAALGRDDTIDTRRDIVMAARLKTLLGRHRRVLYVCGLAHWNALQELLAAERPGPAEVPDVDDAGEWQRVVVHPHLAINHLDALPALAEEYERDRPHAGARRTVSVHRHGRTVFFEKLRQSYARYFRDAETTSADRHRDLDARQDFERLLANLCTIRQQTTPNLFAALAAAQGVMSDDFCKVFAEVLMEFPWASPSEFGGLPILAPSPSRTGSETRVEYVGADGRRSPHFFVQPLPGRSGIPLRAPIPWQWSPEPPPPVDPQKKTGSRSDWLPLHGYTTLLALRAVQISREQSERPKTELFEGSLHEGIDVKSTMRSSIRGDDRIYVRVAARRQRAPDKRIQAADCYPFVWILRPQQHPDLRWQFSTDRMSTTLRKHMRDVEACDRIRAELGEYPVYTALATGASRRYAALSIENCNVDQSTIYGRVDFNWGPGIERSARWLEECDYRRGPILRESPSRRELQQMYQSRHQLALMEDDWPASLVQMALPYAVRSVTVVAPDGWMLPTAVYRQAAARSVEVRVIPLSYLPANTVRDTGVLTWIPTLGRTQDGKDLPIYPEHVLRHYNEDVEKYRKLMPKGWF